MIRRLLWVMVAATCCVGVAACGGDDDSDADDSATTTTESAAATTDWAVVSAHLLDDMSTQRPGITEARASADGSMLELHVGVGDAGEDVAQFAFLAVQDIQKRHPAALDGIEDVKVHVEGPSGETEETYPYNEIRSWIETGAIGTGAVDSP